MSRNKDTSRRIAYPEKWGGASRRDDDKNDDDDGIERTCCHPNKTLIIAVSTSTD
jgi:hypothetical protein